MDTKLALKRADKVIQRATNYANPRKINGRPKSVFLRAIAEELFFTSKKYFYIGFGFGFIVATLCTVLLLIYKVF